jgi:GNAT superfamily N-acetyltransferase
MSDAGEPTIRAPRPDEYEAWARLYRGYRDFYELAPDEDVLQLVWSWIHDPQHEVRALVAAAGGTDDGTLVGLAHVRRFARPSEGETGLYLDDLFVVPDRRGGGLGRALLDAVTDLARDEGCVKVRWITAEDNVTAQRLYDSLAKRTTWVTYDRMT